jgi:hypothetical protein
MVYRRSGESIVAGEPVITITETQPKKIIAYMPQPLSVEPSVGMKVKVRARTAKRPIGFGKVEQVAAHFAPIPPVLLSPALNRPTEMGVPVDISIPDGLSLRAGEPVDLCFVAWRR